VYATDDGEMVARGDMDGAAPDTRLNAQRKAYTAARSDATSTADLAEKARADAAEREHDPSSPLQGRRRRFRRRLRAGGRRERSPRR
jgi:uncharacterized protein GlcG (DUF336 family)